MGSGSARGSLGPSVSDRLKAGALVDRQSGGGEKLLILQSSSGPEKRGHRLSSFYFCANFGVDVGMRWHEPGSVGGAVCE
jgi:hypothetical protein